MSGIQTRRDYTPISGSAGVLFDATETMKLGLTLSSSARAPAQTELFARGPHDGPATYETGDPSLQIERANSLEGTIRVRTNRLLLDASVWTADFSDYIYGDLTGQSCTDNGYCVPDDTEDLKELFYKQVGARFWGAEAKPTIEIYRSNAGVLEANFLADYVRAKLHGAGNVPRIPPYHLGGGLSWTSDMLDGGFMVKYTGAQKDIASADTPTPGFISLSAQIAWRPFQDNPKLELAVIGRNLTNSRQRNAVALNKGEFILPGRDVRFVVRTTF